jgi:ketosteroid isomerase-like protein
MRVFLDPSVIYLRGGTYTAYGSERAMRLIDAPQPQAPAFSAWQPIGGGLSRDRLSGYTFGIAVRTAPEQPGALVERYIAFWSRFRGGPWRISGYVEVSPGQLSTTLGDRTPGAVTPAPGLSAMLAADSLFAERARSRGAGFAARDAMAEDGVLLATTQLVVGPLATSDYFESLRSFSISWVPRDARVAASGDLGFTVGDAVVTSLGPTGAASQSFTKYLTVWRKDLDGAWRVVVTGANDRPSPIGD